MSDDTHETLCRAIEAARSYLRSVPTSEQFHCDASAALRLAEIAAATLTDPAATRAVRALDEAAASSHGHYEDSVAWRLVNLTTGLAYLRDVRVMERAARVALGHVLAHASTVASPSETGEGATP